MYKMKVKKCKKCKKLYLWTGGDVLVYPITTDLGLCPECREKELPYTLWQEIKGEKSKDDSEKARIEDIPDMQEINLKGKRKIW